MSVIVSNEIVRSGTNLKKELDPREEKILVETTQESNDSYRAADAPITISNDPGICVDPRWFEGPEIIKDVSPLYSVESDVSHSSFGGHFGVEPDSIKSSKPLARVLGLRRKTFWFVAILGFAILGVAVGGGVGAGLIRRKGNNTERATSTPAASDSPFAASSTLMARSTLEATSTIVNTRLIDSIDTGVQKFIS